MNISNKCTKIYKIKKLTFINIICCTIPKPIYTKLVNFRLKLQKLLMVYTRFMLRSNKRHWKRSRSHRQNLKKENLKRQNLKKENPEEENLEEENLEEENLKREDLEEEDLEEENQRSQRGAKDVAYNRHVNPSKL